MTKIKVLHNQTIFDIAIQYFGTVDAAFDIAMLNNISITDVLPISLELSLPETDYGFNEVVSYYKSNKVAPATADQDSYLISDYIFSQTLPIIL